MELYFGKTKKRLITYGEFSQFLHDFHEEYAIEGFRKADRDGTGFISVLDFQDIMTSIKSHLLTKQVQSHLIEVSKRIHGSCCFIIIALQNSQKLLFFVFLHIFINHNFVLN